LLSSSVDVLVGVKDELDGGAVDDAREARVW
jgi:hypothetical protein